VQRRREDGRGQPVDVGRARHVPGRTRCGFSLFDRRPVASWATISRARDGARRNPTNSAPTNHLGDTTITATNERTNERTQPTIDQHPTRAPSNKPRRRRPRQPETNEQANKAKLTRADRSRRVRGIGRSRRRACARAP
jgi:hypothetical protein